MKVSYAFEREINSEKNAENRIKIDP